MDSDTGIKAALEWLTTNHPDWTFQDATSRLIPGDQVGSPTRLRVRVTLTSSHLRAQDGPWLVGDGSSILEATQLAVGMIR